MLLIIAVTPTGLVLVEILLILISVICCCSDVRNYSFKLNWQGMPPPRPFLRRGTFTRQYRAVSDNARRHGVRSGIWARVHEWARWSRIWKMPFTGLMAWVASSVGVVT